MAITQKGDYYYGDNVADLKILLGEYSEQNGHPAAEFEQSVCICGGKKFVLSTDERQGVAIRQCTTCNDEHVIIDDENMLAKARPEEHGCICEKQAFFLVSAIAAKPSNDKSGNDKEVSWYYQGGMCPSCRLIGVYADWTCSGDITQHLKQV